jgi:hypothetical protein
VAFKLRKIKSAIQVELDSYNKIREELVAKHGDAVNDSDDFKQLIAQEIEPAAQQSQDVTAPIPGSTLDLQRQRAAAAQIPTIDIDVEPAPAPQPAGMGQWNGQWKVLVGGQEVYRFGGVGNSQADANRIAAAWLRQNGQGVSGEGFEVYPVMDESLREYRMPQPSQGPGKYKDLNEPLGPETPPKMPSGTIKVDVSDTQDWYQLGQDISNLDYAIMRFEVEKAMINKSIYVLFHS